MSWIIGLIITYLLIDLALSYSVQIKRKKMFWIIGLIITILIGLTLANY